jgi:hypothetical protein
MGASVQFGNCMFICNCGNFSPPGSILWPQVYPRYRPKERMDLLIYKGLQDLAEMQSRWQGEN